MKKVKDASKKSVLLEIVTKITDKPNEIAMMCFYLGMEWADFKSKRHGLEGLLDTLKDVLTDEDGKCRGCGKVHDEDDDDDETEDEEDSDSRVGTVEVHIKGSKDVPEEVLVEALERTIKEIKKGK